MNLSPEERLEIVRQRGRRSDQAHNFKKWLLVAGCLIFCFVVLVITGIIIYMVGQGQTALLAPIFSGIGGAIAGIGGTLGFVALRQWRQ